MLYVDDLLDTRSNSELIASVKSHLQQLYDMKDFGLAKKCLGIEFLWTSTGMILNRTFYYELIHEFGMHDFKSECIPRPEGHTLTS